MGNGHFEDRGRQLKGLPSLSTDFHSWLELTVGICLSVSKQFHRKSLWFLFCEKHILKLFREFLSIVLKKKIHYGNKNTKPDDIVRKSALAEIKPVKI